MSACCIWHSMARFRPIVHATIICHLSPEICWRYVGSAVSICTCAQVSSAHMSRLHDMRHLPRAPLEWRMQLPVEGCLGWPIMEAMSSLPVLFAPEVVCQLPPLAKCKLVTAPLNAHDGFKGVLGAPRLLVVGDSSCSQLRCMLLHPTPPQAAHLGL
jgi:hypothetical protein